jgi:nucleoside-diphosphate-sugar epimerase
MARVVVTGGSGKLGRAVIRELLAHGWTVVNLDRAPPPVPMPEEACRFTRIDFTDYGQTVEALTSIDGGYSGVDAAVDLAANAATFANNITSTYNVFPGMHVTRGLGTHETLLSVEMARRVLG